MITLHVGRAQSVATWSRSVPAYYSLYMRPRYNSGRDACTPNRYAILYEEICTRFNQLIVNSIQFNSMPTFTYMYMYYNIYENKNTLNVETGNERSRKAKNKYVNIPS